MTSALLPLYQQASELERVIHGVGAPLVGLYWRPASLLLYFQYRLGGALGSRTNLVLAMPIGLSGFDHTTMVPRPDFYRFLRKVMINPFRDEIASFTEQGITLKSGQQLEVNVVILATEWRTDYSFLNDNVIAERSSSTTPGTVTHGHDRTFESA